MFSFIKQKICDHAFVNKGVHQFTHTKYFSKEIINERVSMFICSKCGLVKRIRVLPATRG